MPALIVILVLVIAAAVFFIVRSKRLKTDLAQLSRQDQKGHDNIVAADKAVKEAQKAYGSAVRQALENLKAAGVPGTLASVGQATITETSVVLNGRPRPLTPGITAQVDASGDVQKYGTSRSTATRVVTGALLAGPVGAVVGGVAKKNNVHTNDTRQLFLIVTGPDWQEVVQLQPALDLQARQFAAALYSVAPHAAGYLQQYQSRVAQAKQAHRATVADDVRLDAATQARAVLGLDPLDELRKGRKLAMVEKSGPKSLPGE